VIGAPAPLGVLFDSRFKGKGFDYILNIGAIWKPVDKLTLGASYKNGKNISFDGDLDLTNIPASLGMGDAVSYEAKLNFLLPTIVTWGVGYDFLDNLKVEFDVDWSRWSSLKTQTIDVPSKPELSQTFTRNWTDSFMYSVGSEWYMKQWLAVRLGYTFAERSIPITTFDASIPDTQRHIAAVGFGIKYKKYLVNLAYNVVFSKAVGVDTNVLSTYADLDGTYDGLTHIVALGLQYKF
jgi:long-chain fatty acid transport protein